MIKAILQLTVLQRPVHAICLCLAVLASQASAGLFSEDYLRIDQYIEENPQQKNVMQRFSQIVRDPAVSINRNIDTPTRIAVIYPAIQASDYWHRSLKAFEARLKELDVNYELKTYLSRPSVDISLQSEQLADALRWNPDYLVFTIDALRHRTMIERILTRGRPKLILQNITTPVKLWQYQRPFMYVGFDHAIGTELLAESMQHQVAGQKSPVKYSMLYFSKGYVSQMRGDTFASHVSGNPHIKQVSSFYTDGNRLRAKEATLKTLQQNPDLDMIFACSTDIALGAIDALNEKGLSDQILINGWGGGDSELTELQAGKLDLTVMRMNDDNGVAMAEGIKLDLEGRGNQVPHIYSGDIRLLSKETSAEQIEKYKKWAFRYSGY